MFDQILLTVDLNDKSSWNTALPVASKLCRDNQAALHLLTVIPDFGMSIVSHYFPEGYEKEIAKKTLEQLHAFSKKHVANDVKVQHIVGEGTVYQVILRVADDIHADLIVMASARPELKDYLLGPNAARVVRHSNCSVLVVRD